MNANASASYAVRYCKLSVFYVYYRRCAHENTCLQVLCSPEYFALSNQPAHTPTHTHLRRVKWYVSGTVFVIGILAKSMKHSKYIARQR